MLQSLSEAQRHNQNFPPKSLPRPVERNRTISEPPDKPGQVTPEPGLPAKQRPYSMRYAGSYSTSPNIKSPISPVGSMSTGISSDGTGSSNSINEPYLLTGEHDTVTYTNQPDVIPEESSGEISIEFNPKPEPNINQTLPRAGPSHQASKYVHQKQASLTEFTMEDYLDMSLGPPTPSSASSSSKTPLSYPGPPLPRRNNEDSLASSMSSSKLSSVLSPVLPHPPASSYGSGGGDYHVMSPAGDTAAYFDMERGAAASLDLSSGSVTDQDLQVTDNPSLAARHQLTILPPAQVTSTPLKSTSTVTLVHSESSEPRGEARASPSSRTSPVDIRPLRAASPAPAPLTVLTPPSAEPVSGRGRVPSGDGYVVMSPGVAHNTGPGDHSSLAILEESLGK